MLKRYGDLVCNRPLKTGTGGEDDAGDPAATPPAEVQPTSVDVEACSGSTSGADCEYTISTADGVDTTISGTCKDSLKGYLVCQSTVKNSGTNLLGDACAGKVSFVE